MSSSIDFEINDKLKQDGLSRVSMEDKNTLLIEFEQTPYRFTIYKTINETIKPIERRFKQFINNNLILQQIYLLISRNWDRISNNSNYDKDMTGKNSVTREENKTILNITNEQWIETLREKHSSLFKLILEIFPELVQPLEFAFSVKSILNIKDCSLPFGGIILGPPSSMKTVAIELFRDIKYTHYTDSFSAKSFVSHNTSVKREELHEIDMLPKIKNKLFLTPELSPTFSKKDDELNEILGIITRILDGHGYESDTGAHGHRGYNEDIMFVWIGAAVEIPRKVHKLLGTLGPKLYFFRIPSSNNKTEKYYLEKIRKNDDFKNHFNKIKQSLNDYLEWFENGPDMKQDNKSKIKKIEWNFQKYEEKALLYIIKLARLLARLRGVVPTWETKDTQGSDYGYALPIIEEPDRAMIQLKNLARGHALTLGRNYITLEDIPIVIRTVLSTASRERVILFDKLLENDGLLDSIEIREIMHISKPTVLRTMTEFIVLEIVNKISLDSNDNSAIQIQLKEEFDWFKSEEFRWLRGNFGKEYHKQYLQEKQNPELKNRDSIKDNDGYDDNKNRIQEPNR